MLLHLRLGTICADDIPPHWLDYVLAYWEGSEVRAAKAREDAARTGPGAIGGKMATPERRRQIFEEIAAKQQGAREK